MTPTERWATETTVTLQRYSFERAVRALDRIEALALIRNAYDAPLDEAKEILTCIAPGRIPGTPTGVEMSNHPNRSKQLPAGRYAIQTKG